MPIYATAPRIKHTKNLQARTQRHREGVWLFESISRTALFFMLTAFQPACTWGTGTVPSPCTFLRRFLGSSPGYPSALFYNRGKEGNGSLERSPTISVSDPRRHRKGQGQCPFSSVLRPIGLDGSCHSPSVGKGSHAKSSAVAEPSKPVGISLTAHQHATPGRNSPSLTFAHGYFMIPFCQSSSRTV